MAEEEDLLDILLSTASEELASTNNKQLKEFDIFKTDTSAKKPNKSAVHSGDTDSSEDEENKNAEEKKYNEYGRNIKKQLTAPESSYNRNNQEASNLTFSWKSKPTTTSKHSDSARSLDVFIDPFFGIRISNPIISSAVLHDRMIGKQAVTFSQLGRWTQTDTKDKDWVIAGVIVNKSAPKTSQKGRKFSIWTLSDLKDDIKTAALFLFNNAHDSLWKTTVGTVVGILNPNILDRKDGTKDEASLSIDNNQRVMIFGQSKDFGTCKSIKKNGDQCTAIVNKNRCEYCLYHIKQEYQKCSLRSELQANFTGRGLTALRNKVLGKNEVFYAGKSYMAIPAKKNKKLEQKDDNRLQSLSGKAGVFINNTNPLLTKTRTVPRKGAALLDVSHAQRVKDIALLKKLSDKSDSVNEHSTNITLEESKNTVTDVLKKLKNKASVSANNSFGRKESNYTVGGVTTRKEESEVGNDCNKIEDGLELDKTKRCPELPTKEIADAAEMNSTQKSVTKSDSKYVANSNVIPSLSSVPVLSTGNGKNNLIDLRVPYVYKRAKNAKNNALELIKKQGPIKKADPNSLRGGNKKRLLSDTDFLEDSSAAKKSKLAESGLISDRFKKMMAATSTHTDLIRSREDEEAEKYFNKLEIKEKMEDKMATTYKVACKAVKCLKCKYTSFSASDVCKAEKHPLKVFDAVKRFFKCGHCGNRTVSLDIIPTRPCSNCGSGKWERTGMMKEKIIAVTHSLSIRGGEQKFINAVATDTNINLLVPESD